MVNPKRQLVRLVRTAAGNVTIDMTGKAAGRGAYVHDQRACWEKALSGQILDHALRTTLSDADRAALRAHGQHYSNDDN